MRRHSLGAVLFTAAITLVLAAGCGALKRRGYTPSDRDEWQKPDEVIAALAIQPGSHVADIGAGGGYFTYRLAEAVGPTGVTYAIDVDTDMTEYLEEETAERGVENVTVILAEYDDPLIPESGVDLIFTSNTYHHIQDRTAYFERARRYLRPGGRVAVVELNGSGWFSSWFDHNTPAETIREELEAAGYQLDAEHDFLEQQHFLVFSVKPG